MRIGILFPIALMLVMTACSSLPPRGMADHSRSLDLIDSGVIALEHGYIEKAQANFQMSYEMYPGAAALDGLGCVALYEGKLVEAEKFFKLALEKDENYHRAVGHLATIAELNGDRKKAEELYREYLFNEPDNIRIRNNFAVFLNEGESNPQRKEARQQLLLANSFSDHPIIINNFREIESTNEK